MSLKGELSVLECVWIFVAMFSLSSEAGTIMDNKGRATTFKFGMKPADKKCHDFCALMSELCRNGGSCVMDDDTCIATCLCAPGWAGRWCRDEVSMPDENINNDTTDAPEPTPIIPDLKSTINDDIKPIADTNTDDAIRLISKIHANETKPFEIRTAKIIEAGMSSNISRHESSYSDGKLSNDRNVNSEKETKLSTLTGVSKCLQTCVGGDCIAKNGDYVCTRRRELTGLKGPKTCQPGFVCQHGVCDTESQDNGLKCICEPNYIGTFCDMKCPFDCGDHGVCDFHVDDGQMKCFCQWNYTGLNCTELIPLPPEEPPIVFHWYVVGISVGIVTVVLAVLAVIPYWMWKRRLVFILKIVHYFQNYEEDDGKEYDAFVSYKSTPEDEKFVLQYLYPKLETEFRFKLCLHFRDFMPGEAIANNIVKAIENSRRTIMVLSPAYVNSEWCRMEYQKAQHEMLKLKHRIIPIVLEDIANCNNMDKNLKGILNSVTYIEWPGEDSSKSMDKFWKKLQLSLPKKSTNSSNTSNSPLHISASAPAVLSSESDHMTDSDINSLSIDSQNSADTIRKSSSSESIESGRRSPRFQKNKKKDLKHFMDKLVRGKLFIRQDSTSSQTALVDEETSYSKGSFDSVSESMLTESTDSACSTPVTAHSYLCEDLEKNAFFSGPDDNIDENSGAQSMSCGCTSESPRRGDSDVHTQHMTSPNEKEEDTRSCEKDHCEFSACTSCSTLDSSNHMEYHKTDICSPLSVDNVKMCRKCKAIKESADNNIVKISPIDGSDMLKIQKVLPEKHMCEECSEEIELTHTESMKSMKDAENMKLLRQSRLTSSLKHRRTDSQQEITLSVKDLPTSIKQDNDDSVFIDICETI